MKNEVFGEYFARRQNLLTGINARIKAVSVVIAMLTVLLSKTIYPPLALILFIFISLLSVKIPLKILMLRMSAPLGAAAIMLLIKLLFCHDRLDMAMLIFLKIIGASSLILFLSMTTTLDKLLEVLRWIRIPGVWIEICLIAYRYIFVLIEDAITVFDAQRVRLGYAKVATALASIGSLVGTIIIRAYDQSVSTYEAMVLRGYKDRDEDTEDA